MGIDLYRHPVSSFCRAVELTAKNLGIELNAIKMDIFSGEQFSESFIALNPQHQIPTINDNGFCLGESVAIMQYLCNAYAKEDNFYPKLTKKRALVDSRLMFNVGSLYKSFADAYYPAIFQDLPTEPAKVAKINENLGYLEGFLQKSKYVASEDGPTIADFGIIATLSTFIASGHSIDSFPNILEYLERCKAEVKGYAENEEGAGGFGAFAKPKIFKENVAGAVADGEKGDGAAPAK